MRAPPPIPNIRHLLAVAAVVRMRHVGRAANLVHLSQSATTQAIAGVEASLGEQLFERTRTGLTATDAGVAFGKRIERAFEHLEAGKQVLGEKAPPLQRLVTTAQLRAFTAVVEAKSYSLAARQLGLSQPSIHRVTREFERLSGTQLLRPTRRGIEPTQTARALSQAVSLALEEIRQGIDELREWRGVVDGPLSIGCLPLARSFLLPTAVTRFLTLHPDIKMQIADGSYTELLHELRHGRLDLIVGALRLTSAPADIQQEVLFSDPLSIVVRAGHPILSEPEPGPERLAQLDWIVSPEGTPARTQFAQFFEQAAVATPRRLIECSSPVATRALLVQSERASVISASQVSYEVKLGVLEMLPAPILGRSWPIGITTRRDWHPTNAQERFRALLRQITQEQTPLHAPS
jgi:LysR family transcriptional regulator, regulator for genes of the gallate degradation pathway